MKLVFGKLIMFSLKKPGTFKIGSPF